MIEAVPHGDPTAGFVSRAILFAAFRDSLAELAPRVQFRSSATLGVYVGSIFTTVIGLVMVFGAPDGARHAPFVLAIAAWLWLSFLLANFANAIAVEWAKARARLRSMGGHLQAKRLLGAIRSEYRLVDAGTMGRNDVVLVEANE